MTTEPDESIRIDTLDGFQFEELCGRIFEKLGLGRVSYIGHVADEGRDLVLESYKGGRAVVECKHWPNSGIGRPIVQKLHSATLSSNANYAIVVTTGHFSKDAVEYANKLRSTGITVELIDFPVLNDMASRAGIRLLHEGQSYPIRTFFVSDPSGVSHKIATSTLVSMVSAPKSSTQLALVHPTTLEFKAAYLIRYNIHENFETSIGRIHSIHLNDKVVLVNGTNGEMLESPVAEFIISSTLSDGIHSGYPDVRVHRQEFKIDIQSLTTKLKKQLIEHHTKSVTYYGRNKVRYTKVCKPGERSIFISSMTQVYYPYWTVSIGVVEHHYHLETVEKEDDVLITETNLFDCRQCGVAIAENQKVLLCNACGAVVHRAKSHGFICEGCEKTICRSCTFWTRKWLILKKKMCEACADELAKKGTQKRLLESTKSLPRS